ncbi:DUF3305 domain-containing protein [Rhodobacteraceae bacterium NNCM2]|nr:DUF3305 domain-containing protein [Coraliihabitans acroporae]
MSKSLPVGVVIRKTPGVTRWAKWAWRAVAVLPGAPEADWRELRREGEAVEYHAATRVVEVHRSETEAYLVALSDDPPSCFVILRPSEDPDAACEYEVFAITLSPFEAQDYADSGEELVERVPMPPALIAWLSDFVGRHHIDEEFIKRRRDKTRVDMVEEGKGDERIRQAADVYRAPGYNQRKLH